MPKKTTILIVILAIITGALIFLAVKNDQMLQKVTVNAPSPTIIMPPYANLSFALSTLDASTGLLSQTVDIELDSAGKPVAGVQVELSYDPKVFTNVSVVPPKNSFFGTNPITLINSVDQTLGRITYAVGISPNDSESVGKGSIGILKFTVNRAALIPISQFTFLPKSAVTTLSTQGSILASTKPLSVIIATTPTTINPTR